MPGGIYFALLFFLRAGALEKIMCLLKEDKMSSILIVDDENEFKVFLARFLERKGIKAYLATTGQEAIQSYQENKPSCVFLDVKLPEMDGEEVFKRLRAIDSQAKIYFVTGIADSQFKETADKLGANGYLVKPITVEDVMTLVKEIL
jgi:DNA-binding response OmpR family regulator